MLPPPSTVCGERPHQSMQLFPVCCPIAARSIYDVELALVAALTGAIRRRRPRQRARAGAAAASPVFLVRLTKGLGRERADAALGVRAQGAAAKKRVAMATPNTPLAPRSDDDQVMAATIITEG